MGSRWGYRTDRRHPVPMDHQTAQRILPHGGLIAAVSRYVRHKDTSIGTHRVRPTKPHRPNLAAALIAIA